MIYRLGESCTKKLVGARAGPVALFERIFKMFENFLHMNTCIGGCGLEDEVLGRRHDGI